MVYLDYAATNPYTKFPCSKYGQFLNPNANYAHKEKHLLHDCEERIKRAIGAKSGKVLFGGTSSQLVENLFTHLAYDKFLYRLCDETDNCLTISSIYEHDAVFRFADQWGNIESLKHTIKTYSGNKQLIVMLQGTNNITGQIMPIVEIGKLCRENGAYFICDLTAHIGHTAIPDNIDEWADCAFWSGYKLGAELGIGCIWLSNQFNDWLGDMTLHGTPNLAGALAICDATEWAVKNVRKNVDYSVNLYCWLKTRLEAKGIKSINVNGEAKLGGWCPCISAIRLVGVNADALQQYAASKDCYISIGASACQEVGNYRVLEQGYGLSRKEASEVIRVSFGENTTYEDLDYLVSIIKEFKELFA